MNNLDKQYQELLNTILEYGTLKKDRTGVGTKSIFGYTIRHNMQEGFPLLTTKKIHWKSVVTELMWFLRGETNIKYLIDNGCMIWVGDAYKRYEKAYSEGKAPGLTLLVKRFDGESTEKKIDKDQFVGLIQHDESFSEKWGEMGPIYGKQWRDWRGVDQIDDLVRSLKYNPDSRRLMVNAWNVSDVELAVLPPCHYGFQVYTKELSIEERLDLHGSGEELSAEQLDDRNVPKRSISLMWNQRSVDTFLGLPFNIASYGLLLCILAEVTNMVPDELIGNLGDTHLYLNHLEQAKEQMNRESFMLPTLWINSEFWAPMTRDEIDDGPFTDDTANLIKSMVIDDFKVQDYLYQDSIKATLNN